MITNAILYRLTLSDFTTTTLLEDALTDHSFVPCCASQEKSIGFIPPRGEEHGALVEFVAGQWFMKLMIETRSVPGSVISLKAKERAAHIESTTGRKPGKKETREIKDDIRLELLPDAFPKQSTTLIWIDPVARLLVIDAASQSKADEVVTMLVKAINGLAVKLLDTKVSPTAAMSEWLISQEPPSGFSIDRECELKAADESKAVIRYSRSPLDTEEVKHYVESGKLPTRLALTWDRRVSFVLTDSQILKRIKFLDVVFENESKGAADSFDADVSIMTGELRKLIPDLLDELGGEVVAS
jgi:recombination associated protein RdgC